MLRRLLDSPWTYFTLAGVLFVILLVTQFEVRLPPRPRGQPEEIARLAERDDLNVLFILVDTLRADRLHAYGYERETSPVMDYLANTGIRFQRVLAQSSWTKASMASMWTATFPRRTGIQRWNHALPEEATLPAEVLREHGFRTAGIYRNGWVAPTFGFSQGFDTYLRPMPRATPARFQRQTPSSSPLQGTDEDLTVAARQFLNSFGRERFFLYIHYMDVHQYAYDEASAKFGTSYSDTYDNAIHWTDRNIGVLLEELRNLDLWKETIVVIASDHGEGFREHGLEGHAKTLYHEVAYVPWIISLPFELRPGLVVEETVGNVDIWPTLFDLLGIEGPSGVDGRSAVPLIRAAAGAEDGAVNGWRSPYYADIDRRWGRPTADPEPLVNVTLGDRRLFQALDASGAEPVEPPELYDRATDPNEQRNLVSAGDGELPPELREALEAYLAQSPDAAPWGARPDERELGEMELHQLRALGYVVE